VVVGQSTGGWATLAYDSVRRPKAVAFVNMAGGRGGRANGEPDSNCRPDLLVAAARRYGESTVVPQLWVYARNDSFFPPDLVGQMYAAFTAAGGRAELVQLGAFGGDGHGLFYAPGGSAVWGPSVERYLLSRGVLP
jgi:pimeloyl-ACP methyl ester carboxylesterase